MATLRWIGGTNAVSQINTITPANVLVGNVFSVVINHKTISFTATVATVANVTAGLVAALSASTEPEFLEVTWTDSTTLVTATAATPGVPFTQTSSATGGTATLTTATPTASTGPWNWDNAANWSGNAVPVNGDDVAIENSAVPILYGLAQSGVALTSLTVSMSFTAFQGIGLPEVNTSGAAPYHEYRPQYLAIAASTVTIGNGSGIGCGRVKLDSGSGTAVALNIYNTGSPAEQNLETVIWKGTNAGNVVNLDRGSFAAAAYAGEVATIATLNIGFVTSQASDVQARFGAGCTLTTVKMTGGQVQLNSGCTTLTKNAGTLTVNAGSITTLTENNGTTYYLGTGTLTTVTVGDTGGLDFSQDVRARTITNLLLQGHASFNDPSKSVTLTNGFTSTGLLGDKVINVGYGRTFTVA